MICCRFLPKHFLLHWYNFIWLMDFSSMTISPMYQLILMNWWTTHDELIVYFPPISALCCTGSTNNGTVHILDIGVPTYPNYVTELSPIHEFSIPSEIFATIYEPESQLFLCATNRGLVGWTKEYDVVTFKLPGKSLQGTACYDEEELVDSVQNVCNG